MSLELPQLFAIGFVYLLLVFGIAHIADRGWIPERYIKHPITYVLSLGVFCGSWAIYGIVGLAHDFGYGFLSYYTGIVGIFIFSPLLLLPTLRITSTFLHSSLADLLTFRFHSQWAGSLITIFMLLASLPLFALQIQAVVDSLRIITTENNFFSDQQSGKNILAFFFCIVLCIFTISFGSRHLTAHERHNGLIAAIAFESLIKVVVMLIVGLVAVYHVFGGLGGLELWLQSNPDMVSMLSKPMRDDSTRTLLIIFFASAVTMPHLFHMIFAENPSPKAIQTSSWGMPLYLMLMSLPIIPILWAGFKLETTIPLEYFTLAIGIELQSELLTGLVYIGGLSAASGAVIVATLALASMCVKHLVLPLHRPDTDRDIYRWLQWIRRVLIVFIILSGFVFYQFIDSRASLSNLGLVAFIAMLQFLPGVLAALYWQGANRNGLMAGLVVGFTIWLVTLLIPTISSYDLPHIGTLYFEVDESDQWSMLTVVSLGMNMLVLVITSMLTRTTEEERSAAQACSTDDLSRPIRRLLSVKNPRQMKDQLATALGKRTAEREVERALQDMGMPEEENRPLALRRLRYKLEANLSGLLGPSVANDMINQLLPYENDADANESEDINLIEGRLEKYRTNLTGLAADLDNLRRYHRQTLQDLPVGVCSLGQDGEVLMWNHTMASFTGVSTADVVGSNLNVLPEPWSTILGDFVELENPNLYKQHVQTTTNTFWFNLHKTTVDAAGEPIDGRVIVLEDNSDIQLLEEELIHSERLASIGRLAAGVAHEIGNPVTGIACLAQNLSYDTDNPRKPRNGKRDSCSD